MLDNEAKSILQEQFSKERNYNRIINNTNTKHSKNKYTKFIKYTLIPICTVIAICTIWVLDNNRKENNVDIAKIRRTPGIGSPNILGI